MQRAFSIALSLAAVALSFVLAFRGAPSLGAAASTTPATVDAGSAAADAAVASVDKRGDAGSLVAAAASSTVIADLLEPTAPALGHGAPKAVRFGVILVTYEGAEGAPEKGARHKSDALELAQKLAEQAKQSAGDFKSAVQHGDTGSSDDVGEVTRGVLEPEPEAVLFALPVGGVSGAIDTPRGFWIVKRLE